MVTTGRRHALLEPIELECYLVLAMKTNAQYFWLPQEHSGDATADKSRTQSGDAYFAKNLLEEIGY